jgi:hypothetical protein
MQNKGSGGSGSHDRRLLVEVEDFVTEDPVELEDVGAGTQEAAETATEPMDATLSLGIAE